MAQDWVVAHGAVLVLRDGWLHQRARARVETRRGYSREKRTNHEEGRHYQIYLEAGSEAKWEG